MDIEKFGMGKDEAYKLWKEYVEACKENPEDKFLQDMKNVYNQLSHGRKVIDIHTVFQRSGLTFDGHPRMAIALASNKKICCIYKKDGTVGFLNDFSYRSLSYAKKTDIIIKGIFPKIPEEKLKDHRGFTASELALETIVPKIPASIRPKGKLNGYYVLWEVEKWVNLPPKDPYLLRRLNDNMFVVVAGWKLTELERAVMKGRVW